MSHFPPPIPPPLPQNAPPLQPAPALLRPHRGGTILALGIISLVFNAASATGGVMMPPCCFGGLLPIALAVPAWVMANADMRLMRHRLMDPSGYGSTQAGRVCAIVSVSISLVCLAVAVLMIAFGLAILSAAASGAGQP